MDSRTQDPHHQNRSADDRRGAVTNQGRTGAEQDPAVNSGPPDAVLWDMDGTLVDTEVHWFAAEADLMAQHGAPWTHQDSLDMVGSNEADMVAAMQGRGLDLSAQEIVEGLNTRVRDGISRDLPLRPGALDLLVACRQAEIPTALVTNSDSVLAGAVLEELNRQARHRGWSGGQLFDIRVTGDLGLPGKPAPAPYTFAARRLSALARERGHGPLNIERMVAIEDSPTGVRSAVAAGATTVAVVNLAPLENNGATVVLDSLDGVTVQDLTGWMEGHAAR